MPLTRELVALASRTASLWIRFLPPVLMWLTLGWLLYGVCLFGSSLLGADHRGLALLVFVVGVIARVLCTIFAIRVLKPALVLGEAGDPRLPRALTMSERRFEVAVATLAPFLAIYSVWGEVDQMVRDGFNWNAVLRQWEPQAWSLTFNLQAFPTYLVMAVLALLARTVWGRLFNETRPLWMRVPILLFEGVWVFSAFFVARLAVDELWGWVRSRRFWRGFESEWNQFLLKFSDIHLPWGSTLPEALRSSTTWVLETLFPFIGEGFALPLVWLALAGVIFGWRDLTVRSLLPERVRNRMDESARSHSGATRAVVSLATDDLRDKYLPVLHALRLIWHSGPYLLGSYVLLAALVELADHWLMVLLTQTFAVGGVEQALLTFTTFNALTWVLRMSVLVALYAATFERAVQDRSVTASAPTALNPPPEGAATPSSPPVMPRRPR